MYFELHSNYSKLALPMKRYQRGHSLWKSDHQFSFSDHSNLKTHTHAAFHEIHDPELLSLLWKLQFSLRCIIYTTQKFGTLNTYKIISIWQLVFSHIRLLPITRTTFFILGWNGLGERVSWSWKLVEPFESLLLSRYHSFQTRGKTLLEMKMATFNICETIPISLYIRIWAPIHS